jgi:hypothetical protein
MYPHAYFDLFPPLPRPPRVFVAMSFDPKFDHRYNDVIVPAIKDVRVDGQTLTPHRVDARHISDSILTEVLTGIGDDLLVFADVTTIGHVDEVAVRNANVMYEVGLAHAIRRAEEVLLFRSDTDRIMFDLANVRINHYEPDSDAAEARQLLTRALQSAVDELRITEGLAVRKALSRLDAKSFMLLIGASQTGSLPVPLQKTVGDVLSNLDYQRAVDRLLDVGALVAEWPKLSGNMNDADMESPYDALAKYTLTELGRRMVLRGAADMVKHMSGEEFDQLVNKSGPPTPK